MTVAIGRLLLSGRVDDAADVAGKDVSRDDMGGVLIKDGVAEVEEFF